MHLHFEGMLFMRRELGPWLEITIRSDAIYVDDQAVAHYRSGFWEVEGVSFVRIQCVDRVCTRDTPLAPADPFGGPWAHLQISNGSIYGDRRLLWKRSAAGRWCRWDGAGASDAIVIHDC
jgi:hypothetical protein